MALLYIKHVPVAREESRSPGLPELSQAPGVTGNCGRTGRKGEEEKEDHEDDIFRCKGGTEVSGDPPYQEPYIWVCRCN